MLKFKEHYNPYVNLDYEKDTLKQGDNLSISSKDQEHTQVKGGRPFQLLQHCNISVTSLAPAHRMVTAKTTKSEII
jgi:hypothetical protein